MDNCRILIDGEEFISTEASRELAHALFEETLRQPDLRNAGRPTEYALLVFKPRHNIWLRERLTMIGGA